MLTCERRVTKFKMTSQSTVDSIGKRVSVALALVVLAILGAVFLHHKRVIAAKQAAATLAANTRFESEMFKYDPDHYRLHQESVKLAGPDAVDCGRVPVDGDPKAASNCAFRVQKKRKPSECALT